MIRDNETVLFTGDSITDCGRVREATGANDLSGLGLGYAKMAAAQLLADRPSAGLKLLNRGISGNRIVDLYARIKSDLINLNPNVVSILVGVNDTCHEFGGKNGVAVPKYERVYRDLLTETREALPGVRFVLCEPFLLRSGGVTEPMVEDIVKRHAVVKRLAQEFGAVFVPFQKVFDDAIRQAPPADWAADGVHPTPGGHMLMARAWLAAVGGAKGGS